MPVPNSFANATSAIPLSQLDNNFATPITIGNTAVQLGNTVTTLNNMTLANVTVSSGNVTANTVTINTRLDLVGDYKENVVTANTGTAYTISLAGGTVQFLTLTGNCTFTFPTATTGQSFMMLLRQDGTGGRTVTWPAAVRWPSGTAPTITSTANRMDKFVFTADGTNWYGSNAGQNYTV